MTNYAHQENRSPAHVYKLIRNSMEVSQGTVKMIKCKYLLKCPKGTNDVLSFTHAVKISLASI